MSPFPQLLNVEAREFSPLALLKISAYEKNGGERKALEKLQSHDINIYRQKKICWQLQSPEWNKTESENSGRKCWEEKSLGVLQILSK